jgi:hypothetical protein
MWARSTSLVIAAALAAGCGSQASAGSDPSPAVKAGVLHLKPGRYTFHVGSDVRVGELIVCTTRSGAPAGGGGVEPRGHGVWSSTGFEAITSADGRVRVACPAHPGNA